MIRKYFLLFVLFTALLLIIAQSAFALTLVNNGRSSAVIIIDRQAPDTVKRAANELQSYVHQVSGALIPIVTDISSLSSAQPRIYIGESASTRELGLSITDLKSDGFLTVVSDKWIAILGRDYNGVPVYGLRNPWRYNEVYNEQLKLGAFGEAGTLYGVYHFLEDFCGVRWYMPGKIGEVVPAKKTITIPSGKNVTAPDFDYRYTWFCDFDRSPDDAQWFRHIGYGAPAPVQIIHAFEMLLATHPDYKELHPDYFALIDGKRDFTDLSTIEGRGNLCLSNPSVAKEWIAFICDYFAQHPEQKVFPLSPNDGMVKICECPDCQAQLSPELGESGKYSNYVWKFVDTVARGVAEKYPDHLVGCIAYEHYNAPPDKIDTLSPNTAVMICKSRGSFVDKKYHARIQDAIDKWKLKTKNIYFWEYYLYSWPPWRSLPVAFPHIISKDLKSLKGISRGEFIESESSRGGDDGGPWGHMNYPGMAHLDHYVTAKCLWNADTDVDKLLNEYYTLFYGPARKDMQQFWQLTESLWNKSNSQHPINVLRANELQKLSGYLEQAKLHTAKGSLYRQRVELIDAEFAKGKAVLLNTNNRKPEEIIIKQYPAKIAADGNLSQQVWKESTSIGFVNKDGNPAVYSTLGFAAADSEALLFTFIMNEPEVSKLSAKCTKRDQVANPGMWQDDSIEVFIAPDNENRKNCYQFTINSKGLVLDQKRSSIEVNKNDVKWNSHAKAKAWRENNRWILQVRIPFKDLNITAPYAGKKLAANFYRNRYCGGQGSVSCWQPVQNNLHYAPDIFGTLIIGQ